MSVISQRKTMWSQIKSTGTCCHLDWSNHGFWYCRTFNPCAERRAPQLIETWGIPGEHNLCKGSLSVLQYLSTSQLQGGNQKHTPLWSSSNTTSQNKYRPTQILRWEILHFFLCWFPTAHERMGQLWHWWLQQGQMKYKRMRYICTVLHCRVRKMTKWRHTVRNCKKPWILWLKCRN